MAAPLTRPLPAAASLTILTASPQGAGARVGVFGLLEPGELAAGAIRRGPTDTVRRPARPPRPDPHALRHQKRAYRATAPSTARSTAPLPCGSESMAANVVRLRRRTTPSDMRSRTRGALDRRARTTIRRGPTTTCRLTASTTELSLSTPSNDPNLDVMKRRRRRAPSGHAPCGARPAAPSQARGRMTDSGADTHSDDRSPPWIYPGLLRPGHLMSPMGAGEELEFDPHQRPCGNGLHRNRSVSGRTSKPAQPFRAASPVPPRKETGSAAPEVPSTRGTLPCERERGCPTATSAAERVSGRLWYRPRRTR